MFHKIKDYYLRKYMYQSLNPLQLLKLLLFNVNFKICMQAQLRSVELEQVTA